MAAMLRPRGATTPRLQSNGPKGCSPPLAASAAGGAGSWAPRV